MRIALPLLVLLGLIPHAGVAQQPFGTARICERFAVPQPADSFADVTYLAGRAGLEEVQGTLYLTATVILLVWECDAQPILSIPLETIDSVRLIDERRDPSLGARLLVGIFAGSRQAEIVTLFAHTETAVEAIVFRVGGHEGAGFVAKLEQQRRKP